MMDRLAAQKTKVDGCLVLSPRVFQDMRGVFLEAYKSEDFIALGLPTEWPQDNLSASHKNVLRGLHLQTTNPQGKLVRPLSGKIFDVCLDLRRGSPTYRQCHGQVLDPYKAMYLPPGTAHGFVALSDDAVVYYKCTTLYDEKSDGGVWAFDKEVKDIWPVDFDLVTMSEKDKRLPTIETWLERNP